MFLQKFAYSEHLNDTKSWELKSFELNNINLIVGSNASGKTRTLNVISGLSRLLSSTKVPFGNGRYFANFKTKDNKSIEYNVEILNAKVVHEELKIENEYFIKRDNSGNGEIKAIQLNQFIKFKIPDDELVAIRKDDVQYPYLNILFQWTTQLRHFRFAKEHEKNTLAIVDVDRPKTVQFNVRETDKAIEVFNQGKKKHGDNFVDNIIKDFNSIGYEIEKLELGQLESIEIESSIPTKIVGLKVKEKDREGYTDQNAMSDGMFRALSIIIHFNYYELENLNGCVLIDDIGEGLDFERSTKLIKLLIDKSKQIDIQLIMSTNDKFVMNNTILDYWQVIFRVGGSVQMLNKTNSAEIFKQFRFTGLNNFEFFTTDFFKTGLK